MILIFTFREVRFLGGIHPGKQGKCGHTRKFCLSSGQFVPMNLVASQGIAPLLMKKQWTYHNDKSTAFIITYRSIMQMLTIKVPNRAKRYNRITPPKTGRKNLGKSTGSGYIFSNHKIDYAIQKNKLSSNYT